MVGAHHGLEDRSEVGLHERVAAVAGDAGEVVAGALDLRGPGVELGEVDGHHGVHRGSWGYPRAGAVPVDVPRTARARNRRVSDLFAHRVRRPVFGPRVRGYPAEVSGSGKRSLMQVEPTRLVELAASSERILAAMLQDWASAVDDLSEACAALGDATGTLNVAASYADSLADADEVVAALAERPGAGHRRAGRCRPRRRARRRRGSRRARPHHPPLGGADSADAGPRRSLTVPANPWELRADVRPLERPPQRWTEVGDADGASRRRDRRGRPAGHRGLGRGRGGEL